MRLKFILKYKNMFLNKCLISADRAFNKQFYTLCIAQVIDLTNQLLPDKPMLLVCHGHQVH